jgi:class 3 adenylate cyclase
MTPPEDVRWRADSVQEYRRDGEELLRKGAPLPAYDILSEGLRHFPGDVRLRQLMALALARTGASRLARGILEDLVAAGVVDEETLGLLARTCKDLWQESADPVVARQFLTLAHERYAEAYRRWGGYWSGINAATTALLLGDEAEAAWVAGGLRARCLKLRESAAPGEAYWLVATLGEASLLLRRWDEAEGWYREAVDLGQGRWGSLSSTRRNARLIVRALGVDGSRIEECFAIPSVVAFAGHLVDRPEREPPRFPPALEAPVRQAILQRLRTLAPGFGYAAAGCGGDILFLEAIQELGGEVQVVLPYDRNQFRSDCVDLVPGADWGDRYDRLLAEATDVTTASDRRLGAGSISYEHGFQVLDGMACLRADALATDLVCMALWDGRSGDGPGGTASSVAHWRDAGRRVEVVDLAAILHRHGALAVERPRPPTPEAPAPAASSILPEVTGPRARVEVAPAAFEPAIVAILFADVRGFSRLAEEELPLFVEHFLGTVARRVEALSHPPLLTNTWGDGLYFVFRGVEEAGTFAMELSRAVEGTHWPDLGLPGGLSLRIALHAGPAYACQDPVTRRPNYLGSNVNMAARIEPVTPPGQVYASGAFAALARSGGVDGFRCGYVGRVPLAKGFGTIPVFVVHRGASPGSATPAR